ncbi:MAG: manganese efflux pump [Ignavibacteria bacterium]|nr:manganese efflux pump [Ignavibacteria bacterium]
MLDFLIVLLIAFALAIDAFAVALCAGAYFGKTTNRQKFRLSFHFGLFQFFMPILGWFVGCSIVEYIACFDHWIALAVLSLIGVKMINEGVDKEKSALYKKDITKGFSLIALAIATSIDALAVGFSIGVVEQDIVFPSLLIGVIAAIMTLLGIQLGEKFSFKFGGKATVFGGIVLILIGIKIVIEHLCL